MLYVLFLPFSNFIASNRHLSAIFQEIQNCLKKIKNYKNNIKTSINFKKYYIKTIWKQKKLEIN